MELRPGNIWSGSRTLAVLTNPTELARKKGNLKNHYPVRIGDHEYADVEDWYQTQKRIAPRQYTFDELKKIMIVGMEAKLKQHPRIMTAITESGGVKFLEACEHRVNGGRWEGKGLDSAFIWCLAVAYRHVMREYEDAWSGHDHPTEAEKAEREKDWLEHFRTH